MKTEKNILVAFILNLAFSIFEFVGGVFVGSVAIVSDAVHDVGDAASIGISYLLEKKSKKQPDEKYTYGYARYSLIGGMITTLILLVGSVVVIYNAIVRIISPVEIHYNGMIIFAVIGIVVNFTAACVTHKGDSFNQKAVNLHMLEDVLGWVVVLLGAIVMRFTDLVWIDPVLSIGVAVFILVHAVENLKAVLDLFLEKIPAGISIDTIKTELEKIHGVENVPPIHVWSMDGQSNYATMHIVTNDDSCAMKETVRDALQEMGIGHATLELEQMEEHCCAKECCVSEKTGYHHHHHH